MAKGVKKISDHIPIREMDSAYAEFLKKVSMIETQADDRLRRLFADSEKKQIEQIKKSLKS
jgi:hypothetical protein